jgi:hypothetical protein
MQRLYVLRKKHCDFCNHLKENDYNSSEEQDMYFRSCDSCHQGVTTKAHQCEDRWEENWNKHLVQLIVASATQSI